MPHAPSATTLQTHSTSPRMVPGARTAAVRGERRPTEARFGSAQSRVQWCHVDHCRRAQRNGRSSHAAGLAQNEPLQIWGGGRRAEGVGWTRRLSNHNASTGEAHSLSVRSRLS
uniref:Uncharacterized protein n=1 Tax=Knipowitschia caucasica TaxID=637954 RepID=A0AAV2J0A6_KNICA